MLALEPEVASIYCRKIPGNLIPDQLKRSNKFDVDSEYVIIDAGGKSDEKLENMGKHFVLVHGVI